MHVTGIIKAKGLSIVLLIINRRHNNVLFLLYLFKISYLKENRLKNSATELLTWPSNKVWCASVVYFSSTARSNGEHNLTRKMVGSEKWKGGRARNTDLSKWEVQVYVYSNNKMHSWKEKSTSPRTGSSL